MSTYTLVYETWGFDDVYGPHYSTRRVSESDVDEALKYFFAYEKKTIDMLVARTNMEPVWGTPAEVAHDYIVITEVDYRDEKINTVYEAYLDAGEVAVSIILVEDWI